MIKELGEDVCVTGSCLSLIYNRSNAICSVDSEPILVFPGGMRINRLLRNRTAVL